MRFNGNKKWIYYEKATQRESWLYLEQLWTFEHEMTLVAWKENMANCWGLDAVLLCKAKMSNLLIWITHSNSEKLFYGQINQKICCMTKSFRKEKVSHKMFMVQLISFPPILLIWSAMPNNVSNIHQTGIVLLHQNT